jgi:PTHB1 N-terminus
VVGEHTLFILSEKDGKIRYQRRLEYAPSCVHTYHIPSHQDIFESEERSLVEVRGRAASGTQDSPCFTYVMGSFNGYLMVYKDVQLVWTAKTLHAPIYVNVQRIDRMDGLIVTLSDNGYLSISYLGTEAPRSQVQATPGEARDQSYTEMSIEHQRLLARIRNHEDDK